jgi:coenzyme Q-binding protein COQ10
MPKLEREITSRFSIEQLYEIVSDIESYPLFVPWCRAARITEKVQEDAILAELLIGAAGFSMSYVSRVTFTPPHSDQSHCAEVSAALISGPFKYLYTSWQLTETEGKTKVVFAIDFAFKSVTLSAIVGTMLLQAFDEITAAFKKRAEELYSKPLA